MFEWVVTGLNIMATMVLAISGVSQAARQRMDFFGALVLACVCALGGGSLRDLLIGATPVFWTRDLTYLAVILPTTVVTILVVQYIPPGRGIRLRILDVADAVGLALFAILGAQKALYLGFAEPVAVVMGVVTGIAGGMIRDLLSQSAPMVMREEIYASAAIVGIISYTLLRLVLEEVPAMVAGMIVVVLIRLAAIFWHWRMPILRRE
ncbi:MAG: trimeric intracellular cation channel family protein [Thiothrix sp.]|nr:trimeric intracellular cation channel family protein [Thiothrix sp.]